VAQLAKAHTEGRIKERLMHYAKPKLLIIDELGYLPFEPYATPVLQLISRRYIYGPAHRGAEGGREQQRRREGREHGRPGDPQVARDGLARIAGR